MTSNIIKAQEKTPALLAPRRAGRYWYLRLLRLQGTPHSLALGSALGAAIGITPTVPLHTAFIIAATLPLRANTVAGIVAANVISNPLTIPAQYYLSWKIGDMLLPGRLTWNRLHEMMLLIHESSFVEGLRIMTQSGLDAMLVILAGGLVLAIPAGILSYLLMFRVFARLQEKRRSKHLLKKK